MSQRLISKTRKHIGTTSAGLAVFALTGAQDDDNTDDVSGGDGSGENDGGDGSEGQTDGKKDGDVISKEEYDKIVDRMKAADRNAQAALAKVKEYEDKDKGELEKATETVQTLTAQVQERDEVIKSLRLENTFALNTKYSWHDPSDVMELIRKREDVTIDEDGKVKGLDKALDDIAAKKKYLVKQDGQQEQEQDPPPSGSSTGSGQRGKGKGTDAEALRKKYPALNV